MTPLSFPTPPARILIIKPSAIGDVVHALPVLNLVRRKWPSAKISWLVTAACAGLLENHPQLDEVILFNRRRFGHGWRSPRTIFAIWKFARSLRRRRFDLVIDMQGLLRSGWMARATAAPIRVGPSNAREFGWLFYTHRVPVSWDWHAVDGYLAMADALGGGKLPVEFRFATTDADRATVAAMLPAAMSQFAVLLPGTNWKTKRWPVEHFAAMVEPLKSRFGLDIVIAGHGGDSELAEQIPGGVNLCGKTTLQQLVPLLGRAELVIANDSGPMHIAAALGRPLVTPYGPTNPDRTGPYQRMESVLRLDLPCSPCYSRRCSHQSCLKWLTPEDVLAHAGRQISLAASTTLYETRIV